MAFQYRGSSDEEINKRANAQGGNFISIFKDHVIQYKVRDSDKDNSENVVRILPAAEDYNPRHYGMDIWVHNFVGPSNAKVICVNKTFNKGLFCPACDDVAKAERLGDAKFAKKVRAGRRVCYWVVDRLEEAKGVQIWSAPSAKIDRELCTLSINKRTGSVLKIDHPEHGYDIVFRKAMKKTGDGEFPEYSGLRIEHQPSSVAETFLEYIEKNLMSETLVWKTKEEIRELLDGGKDAPPPRPRDDGPAARPHSDDGSETRQSGWDRPADASTTVQRVKLVEHTMDGRGMDSVPPIDLKAERDGLDSDADALRQDVIGAERAVSAADRLRERFATKNK